MSTPTKRPAKPRPATEPGNLDLAPGEQIASANATNYTLVAAEATKETPDFVAMAMALRDLGEPDANTMAEFFPLAVAERNAQAAIVASGEGALADERQFKQALASVRRNLGHNDALEEASQIQSIEQKYWHAFRCRTAAESAKIWLGGLEGLIPRLFGLDPETLGRGPLPPTLGNWLTERDLKPVFKDGWIFSEGEPDRRRRYRLRPQSLHEMRDKS